MIELCAYTDGLSYEPGALVSVYVDTEASDVTVALERIVPRSTAPAPAMMAEPVAWTAAGTYPAVPQETCIGSFLHAPGTTGAEESARLTVGAWVWSARWLSPLTQTVVEVRAAADRWMALTIEEGCLTFSGTSPHGTSWRVTTTEPLVDRAWYLVAGVLDGSGHADVVTEPVLALYGSSSRGTAVVNSVPLPTGAAMTIAGADPRNMSYTNGVARGLAQDVFTGKVEAPFYAHSAVDIDDLVPLARGLQGIDDVLGSSLIAAWDLSLRAGDDPNLVRSQRAGGPNAFAVNVPTRGVQGKDWTGNTHDFAAAPSEYGAIHFHEKDIADAGWTALFTAALPDDLQSGMYGISIVGPHGSDTVPIIIVPSLAQRGKHRVAVLMPTFSYLAYANEQLYNSGMKFSVVTDADLIVSPFELDRAQDPRVGLSLYDHHADGSGVAYSTARRPILNMRYGQDMWLTGAGRGLAGDMYLIEWLDRKKIAYEVITDLELHLEGRAAVDAYDVVITGSHPEYYSTTMLDALESYRDGGGGIMYLGGNGFYWVTQTYSVDPLVVEIRRGYAGVRSWESLPGEVTLVSSGELGGLWRHRGRAPQRLVGVGFCAQGWGRSEPYRLSPAAAEDRYKWIFDGTSEDPLGPYGIVMGGAAGDELDRIDFALGTPPAAAVLGSSFGHTNFYQRVVEEIAMGLPDSSGGQQDPEIKADIVYFETPGGGRVFSTGSIAWSGSLLFDDGVNAVSLVTENVIRSFIGR